MADELPAEPPEEPPKAPPKEHPNDPLHGVTLKAILEDLVERRGWDDLAAHVRIRCFSWDPSITSSLKFLRRTEWARKQVEELYIEDQRWLRRES